MDHKGPGQASHYGGLPPSEVGTAVGLYGMLPVGVVWISFKSVSSRQCLSMNPLAAPSVVERLTWKTLVAEESKTHTRMSWYSVLLSLSVSWESQPQKFGNGRMYIILLLCFFEDMPYPFWLKILHSGYIHISPVYGLGCWRWLLVGKNCTRGSTQAG